MGGFFPEPLRPVWLFSYLTSNEQNTCWPEVRLHSRTYRTRLSAQMLLKDVGNRSWCRKYQPVPPLPSALCIISSSIICWFKSHKEFPFTSPDKVWPASSARLARWQERLNTDTSTFHIQQSMGWGVNYAPVWQQSKQTVLFVCKTLFTYVSHDIWS